MESDYNHVSVILRVVVPLTFLFILLPKTSQCSMESSCVQKYTVEMGRLFIDLGNMNES